MTLDELKQMLVAPLTGCVERNASVAQLRPVSYTHLIDFILPQDCPITRVSRPMSIKPFGQEQQNFTGHSEFIEEVL